MELKNDYKSEIQIDPDNLDIECLKQPELYMKYSEMLAAAKKNLDIARRNLDKITAKISKQIRLNKKNYTEDGKLTENLINCFIQEDDAVEEANQALIEAKYEHDVLQSIVIAFDHRKRSLNNLILLHGQQYFSGPSNPRPLGRKYVKEQVQEISKNKVREAFKKRRD